MAIFARKWRGKAAIPLGPETQRSALYCLARGLAEHLRDLYPSICHKAPTYLLVREASFLLPALFQPHNLSPPTLQICCCIRGVAAAVKPKED